MRLSFVSDTFKRTVSDLLHFGIVLFCVNFANVMIINVMLGPYIERASTFTGAKSLSLEVLVNGFYTTPLMDYILKHDVAVSAPNLYTPPT